MSEKLQEHLNKEFKDAITKLGDHAEIANKEMGVIKTDIGWIKKHVESVGKRINKMDMRIWQILGTVVLVGIGQIIATILSK